jgi:UDP-N-acetylmuramate dehydrogenase
LQRMRVTPDKLAEFRAEVPLADFTTIHLGGNAQYFIVCRTIDEILSAVSFFQTTGIPIFILGGGSNVVFPDHGFRGLVLKIDLRGVRLDKHADSTVLVAKAGESWDDMVKLSAENDLAGIECLSGIPGSVGATPIQNVGAYGQEVKDTIVSVKALDRSSLDLVEFNSADCRFGYRRSRFKFEDRNRYVILEVSFKLVKSGEPTLRYDELKDYVESHRFNHPDGNGRGKLGAVREAVLTLRRKKSMVLDASDPNSKSVGSFFINPVLSDEDYAGFVKKLESYGIGPAPSFRGKEGTKVPAAWLVENAGFRKGRRRGGVGISTNHALALVNYSGNTKELLTLASEIEDAVLNKFGIKLDREAVIVE